MQTALTFDPPPGDGSENDDQAQQAIDGDAATFWETETYRSDPVLSKGGVGLVLALPARERVAAVELRTPARPASPPRSTRRADAAPPDRWTAGTSGHAPRADLEDAASGSRCAKPARARFILVWITRLAPAEGAGFSAQIAEASAARIVTYTGSVAAVGDDLAVRGRAAQRTLGALGRARRTRRCTRSPTPSASAGTRSLEANGATSSRVAPTACRRRCSTG